MLADKFQLKNNNIIIMFKIIILISLLQLFLSCPNNCLFCSSETSCQLCSQKYILTTSGSCITQSIPNCKVQINSISCAICTPTFQPINGQCVKDYSGCIVRDINGDCQFCAFGTVLSHKSCKGVINCQNSMSETQCQKCQQGYFLSRGSCIQTRTECVSKLPNGVCSACSPMFTLNGFACIDPTKLPAFCSLFNATNGRCSVCEVGYELYRGNCERKDSIPFLKSSYSTFGLTNSLVMPQDFLDAPTGITKSQVISQDYMDVQITVKMSSGNSDKKFCWQRSINGLCQVCFEGYKLQNGNCVKNTPVCAKFDENNRWCVECRSQLSLSKGVCVDKNCGVAVLGRCATCFNSFKVNDQGLCIIDNCITMQAGECIKCNDGYSVTSSKYCEKNGVKSEESANIPGCALANNGVCVRCIQNFFPNDKGGCKRIIIGCLQYDSKEINCLNCISIYTKTADGGCLFVQAPSTPTPQQLVNKSQSNHTLSQTQVPDVPKEQPKPVVPLLDPNCLIRNNGSCAICRPRYILNLKTLICDIIPQQCLTFSSSNGDCLTCSAGYNLFGRWCLPPFAQIDSNCASYNVNNYCTTCKSQFYKSKGRCFPINTICKAVNLQGGDCLSCYTGYFLDSGDCVQLTKQPACTQYDFQMNCIKCGARYYLQAGVCILINPLCNNFNSSNGLCLDCIQGYGISSKNNVCQLVKSPPINCEKADQVGNCLNCINRFYLRSSECLVVPVLCAKYQQIGGKCLQCVTNFTLLQDGTCLKTNLLSGCQGANSEGSCAVCIPQYVLNGNGGCIYRDPFCLNYQSGQCLKCNDAYYLSSGKCIKKVKKSKDPNCLINDLYNFCMSCSAGFYISAGNCQLADQLCATFDSSNGNCLSCYDGYRLNIGKCYLNNPILNCKMFNGSICSVCEDNYYVGKDGSCIRS